jgi:hypothetical protein
MRIGFSVHTGVKMLKPLIIGAIAIVLLVIRGIPAAAQKYVPEAGSGNLVQGPGGPPVTPDTPAYIGQRNGEAYNYHYGYGAAHCRIIIRHEWRHGHRPEPAEEYLAVGTVIVADEVSRRRGPRECFGDLPAQPLGCWMPGHSHGLEGIVAGLTARAGGVTAASSFPVPKAEGSSAAFSLPRRYGNHFSNRGGRPDQTNREHDAEANPSYAHL